MRGKDFCILYLIFGVIATAFCKDLQNYVIFFLVKFQADDSFSFLFMQNLSVGCLKMINGMYSLSLVNKLLIK